MVATSSAPDKGLDGMTLMRYAQVDRRRDAGGTEQYLGQLNQELLARNRMTILQMHLVAGESPAHSVEIETIGRGRIVWVPVVNRREERSLRSLPRRLTRLVQNVGAMTPTNSYVNVRRLMRAAYGYVWSPHVVLSEVLGEFLDAYHVDLVLFHWLSDDIGPLVARATKRRIPYAVIHHFDNHRLSAASSSVWVRDAAAVAGVSTRNVPREIQGRYVNVSDAVDADFFSPHRARSVTRPGEFLVLLPSRIVEGKGHVDLLLATRRLMDGGAQVSVVCAGAVGSQSLKARLEGMVARCGLADRVLFLGRLASADLRDWYAASDVVVLPSNSEGLGRVLLEAQAMAKPVIAYDSGGIPDAVLPGESGFLVGAGDIVTLAERMEFLRQNPEARGQMGLCGRQFIIDHFTVQALVERHEKLYVRLLSGRTSGVGEPETARDHETRGIEQHLAHPRASNSCRLNLTGC